MPGVVPDQPRIYHIVHVDKLASIAADKFLFSDAIMADRPSTGTVIGMTNIKERRKSELQLSSHPGLFVGSCVPFYFCPRSVMLYQISKGNSGISYTGGQDEIVHLVAPMHDAVTWAEQNQRRWAFTLSNAGSRDFEDRADLAALPEINWDGVKARRWSGGSVDPSVKIGKQAEFLVEHSFPWGLIRGIGTKSDQVARRAAEALGEGGPQMAIRPKPEWYY